MGLISVLIVFANSSKQFVHFKQNLVRSQTDDRHQAAESGILVDIVLTNIYRNNELLCK